jgi:hypothetical protein
MRSSTTPDMLRQTRSKMNYLPFFLILVILMVLLTGLSIRLGARLGWLILSVWLLMAYAWTQKAYLWVLAMATPRVGEWLRKRRT